MDAIGSIAAVALLVATAVLPLGMQQAFARHHHFSVKIHQPIDQSNYCEDSYCSNSASNSATVGH